MKNHHLRRLRDIEGNHTGGPRRQRMATKDHRALPWNEGPPAKKPSKAQRAARRRLTKRPHHNAPWWRAICEAVLSVGRCLWCGATKKLTVDHIRPLSRGGTNDVHNLQCLCVTCNKAKGDHIGLFFRPP